MWSHANGPPQSHTSVRGNVSASFKFQTSNGPTTFIQVFTMALIDKLWVRGEDFILLDSRRAMSSGRHSCKKVIWNTPEFMIGTPKLKIGINKVAKCAFAMDVQLALVRCKHVKNGQRVIVSDTISRHLDSYGSYCGHWLSCLSFRRAVRLVVWLQRRPWFQAFWYSGSMSKTRHQGNVTPIMQSF